MTLYGVGLGPGDPDLVTVRGGRILGRVETVFTPGQLAEELATAYTPSDRIQRLSFPMIRDGKALREAWTEVAQTVAPVARDGDAAFATIGDPKVYSTFAHLKRALEEYPEVSVEAVPGVSVVTAFTSALDVEIGNGPVVVTGASDAIPENAERLLLLKVTDASETHRKLTEAGYSVTFGRRLFMPDSTITTDPGDLKESDYFTIAFGTRRRSE